MVAGLRCYASSQQFRYTPHARVHPAFPPVFEGAQRVRGIGPLRNSRIFAVFRGCAAHPLGGGAMKPVHHSIRLPVAHDKALRAMAERHGISVYAMLQRSVKTGIATLANPPAPDFAPREIVTELASVSTRIVDVERMLDRALFTACAAYCRLRCQLPTRTLRHGNRSRGKPSMAGADAGEPRRPRRRRGL